jgi:shikimate kinase
VYLRAAPGALRTRLASDDPDRPSLTGGDPLAEIGRVHAARDGLYRELADAVIDASGAPERVGSEMLDVVRGWWGDQAAME